MEKTKMNIRRLFAVLVAASLAPSLMGGALCVPRRVKSVDERGLAQSTESAILIAGAVAVALIVVAAVTAYVQAHLPTP